MARGPAGKEASWAVNPEKTKRCEKPVSLRIVSFSELNIARQSPAL
jgi:hypothetical protein